MIIESLICGAAAGTIVDSAFFPIDTLKTRLQAKGGFFTNGGFKGLYRGFSSAVMGSAPSGSFYLTLASLFFVSYDYFKSFFGSLGVSLHFSHMIAASIGEVTACLVRVPTEVIKQRMQTGQYKTITQAFISIRSNSYKGFYRGFSTTVAREIPFTCIQFPLYEQLKIEFKCHANRKPEPIEAAVCGSIAGGTAAAITTPLDVIKTRVMLSKSQKSFYKVFKGIIATEGYSKLFSGIGPRVVWISAGGFLFLGAYEETKALLEKV